MYELFDCDSNIQTIFIFPFSRSLILLDRFGHEQVCGCRGGEKWHQSWFMKQRKRIHKWTVPSTLTQKPSGIFSDKYLWPLIWSLFQRLPLTYCTSTIISHCLVPHSANFTHFPEVHYLLKYSLIIWVTFRHFVVQICWVKLVAQSPRFTPIILCLRCGTVHQNVWGDSIEGITQLAKPNTF